MTEKIEIREALENSLGGVERKMSLQSFLIQDQRSFREFPRRG